jgi:uncharacterized protein YqjF (DUF2071 family)
MRWVNLAFFHWRIPAESMRKRVPVELELDVFDGSAWLGITPFEMRGVHASGLPAVPTARDFPELNVRTYVQCGGKSGVYFFSLDAASVLAVVGARIVTELPYFHARMESRRVGEEIRYTSERTERAPASMPVAALRARYRPTGEVVRSEPGSLDHWLTERYALFVRWEAGGIRRLDIEHAPWPLQPASAEIDHNTMADAAGIALPQEKPRVLFARQLDVVAHWPVPA